MAKIQDVGSTRNPKDNPKMLAEKVKNRARNLPGKYTVKTGDSWATIARKIYGPVFQDNVQAERMSEQLARANPKVGGLRPGTVVRIARPRRNAYVSQAFLGDGAAPTPTAPAYTGAAPAAPTVQGVAPTVNYNAASTQGRPWAQGGNMPATAPIQGYTLGTQPAQTGPKIGGYTLPTLPGSNWAAGVINTVFGRNPTPQAQTANVQPDPVYPRTYLPGKAPTQPVQGLGYGNFNQPVTVERNRPQATPTPVNPYRQQLIDRGNAMPANQEVGFTSVVDQEL
ncbi:MAG: hypothetical protein WC701_13515, partial [Kiritimatiellales bacterium]